MALLELGKLLLGVLVRVVEEVRESFESSKGFAPSGFFGSLLRAASAASFARAVCACARSFTRTTATVRTNRSVTDFI